MRWVLRAWLQLRLAAAAQPHHLAFPSAHCWQRCLRKHSNHLLCWEAGWMFPSLLALPVGRFDAVLRQERRVSSEGCVSVGGNYYSVPDGTRRRTLDVETTPDQVRIHEDGRLIAVHTLLQGRKQRSVLSGHRHAPRRSAPNGPRDPIRIPPGHVVTTRPLSLYEQIGRQLGGRP